jgi:TRAP-type C4-dicarboxylate transport system permease small subunit
VSGENQMSPKNATPNLLVRLFTMFENILGKYLSATVIFLMMAMIITEIFSRKLFNTSFSEVVDLVSLFMLLIVFCSLSSIQRDNAHIKIDILEEKLSGIKSKIVNIFSFIVSFAVSMMFTYSAFQMLHYTIKFNVLSEGARLPVWMFVLFIPISLLTLSIRLLSQLLQLLFGKDDQAPSNSP